MVPDVDYSLRYQNSQGGCIAANRPFNQLHAHTSVPAPTAPTSGSSSIPIHATPLVGPSIPTYLYRALLSEDEIGTNNLAESLLSGGPCADMDFCRYLPKLSRGYHSDY